MSQLSYIQLTDISPSAGFTSLSTPASPQGFRPSGSLRLLERDKRTSKPLTGVMPDPAPGTLLARLDSYYDTAPRATARVEAYGALVLFVPERGWPFYARPSLNRLTEPSADEVREVLARQTELGLPRSLEWVHETAPSLAETARAAGMTVQHCPLLVLGSLVEPHPMMAEAPAGKTPAGKVLGGETLAGDTPAGETPAGEVRLVNAEDAQLGPVQAAINVAFGTPGTAVAPAGTAERDHAAASPEAARRLGFTVDALREGRNVQAGAFVSQAGAVGGGSHIPRGQISEIVGVGVLPSYRRRGLAGAIAHLLASNALHNDVTTVFCSAETAEVARIYESVGFRQIATSCIAEVG